MSKYLIKETNNNKQYQPSLIGLTVGGQQIGEYIIVDHNNNQYRFLATELTEIIEVTTNTIETIIEPEEQIKPIKQITNKTNVINSIQVNNKSDDYYKEIATIKRRLRQCTNKDIESIEYCYRRLIQLTYLSGIGSINKLILSELKNTCKEIIKSNIKLNCWEYEDVKNWINKGIC